MAKTHPDLARVLIDAERIRARVREIARQIDQDYRGAEQVHLVGILKGAFIFLADLARELQVPHIVDFMALSSYGLAGASGGAVRIIMDLRQPIAGRHVVLVEDIVDTGQTLNYLYRTLSQRQPASLRTCVLLRKQRPGVEVPIDYLGFEIPDVWVVGYGLDYAEQHRTLPFIAELRPEVYREEARREPEA